MTPAGVRDDVAFVGVVTDSTACLPPEMTEPFGDRLSVVPLSVMIDGEALAVEDDDAAEAAVAAAQRRGAAVSTASPSPENLLEVYEALFAQGASAIVSVHASAALSATHASAVVAASRTSGHVHVLDSATLGMAMGFAALEGARLAANGADLADVSARVAAVCESSVTVFTVETLEPLRRGGRIGRASALLGSALSIRPLLQVQGGVIAPMARVRTSGKAVTRLAARTSAGCAERDGECRVAVHGHDGGPLLDAVMQALQATHVQPVLAPLGPVVAAHVGAGAVAITVVDAFAD